MPKRSEDRRWQPEHFDYGEAIYRGAWQNIPVRWTLAPHDARIAGNFPQPDFTQPAVTGGRADRRVIHLRKQRLFVVAEAVRLEGAERHACRQPLTLMLTVLQQGASKPFGSEQLALDSPGKTVRTANPDTPNGTRFSVPSYGWFTKRPPVPAVAVSAPLAPGLRYELVHAPWTVLFSRAHWMKPEREGTVLREMEIPVPQTNHYAVIYKGYIRIPQSGVYTFHAPREYVWMDTAASYDLRLYLDGEEWDLTQWWHGLGTWSLPLEAGLHRFQLDFADARTTPYRPSGLWRWYPTPRTEYRGPPSELMVSGPGLAKQRIPEAWLLREE
jgi:hypothetical protein